MTEAAADVSMESRWVSRRAGDAGVAVGTVPAATRFRRHVHEGPHLCGVLAGGFVEKTRGAYQSAGPGTVRFSASASHDIDFGSRGARCLVITFDDAPDGFVFDRSRFLADEWLAAVLTRVGAAISSPAPAAGVALDHGIAELLAQILRRTGARAAPLPPPWLRDVRDVLCDRRGEAMALDDLARPLGVHRAHLARAFRDHYGITIGAFVRRLRLERALHLIADPGRSLADVALEAGYADQSHMTRAFAATLRTTPGRLRRDLGCRAPRVPWPKLA